MWGHFCVRALKPASSPIFDSDFKIKKSGSIQSEIWVFFPGFRTDPEPWLRVKASLQFPLFRATSSHFWRKTFSSFHKFLFAFLKCTIFSKQTFLNIIKQKVGAHLLGILLAGGSHRDEHHLAGGQPQRPEREQNATDDFCNCRSDSMNTLQIHPHGNSVLTSSCGVSLLLENQN